MEYLETTNVDIPIEFLDKTDQSQTRFLTCDKFSRRHGNYWYVLFIDFKKAYDSIHRSSLVNIMEEFGFS